MLRVAVGRQFRLLDDDFADFRDAYRCGVVFPGEIGIAVPEIAVFDGEAVYECIAFVEGDAIEFGAGVDIVFDYHVVGGVGAPEAIVDSGESVKSCGIDFEAVDDVVPACGFHEVDGEGLECCDPDFAVVVFDPMNSPAVWGTESIDRFAGL